MQTNQHNAELLHTQTNVNSENDIKESSSEGVKKGEELIERMEIKGTPFTAIRAGGKCFGTLGRFKITEDRETMPEVEEELTKVTYKTILTIVAVLIEGEVKHQIEQRINKLKVTRQEEMRTGESEENEGTAF